MVNVKHQGSTTIVTPTPEEEQLMKQKIIQLGGSKINAPAAATEDPSIINKKLYDLVRMVALGYKPSYSPIIDTDLPTAVIEQLGAAKVEGNQEEKSSKVMKLYHLTNLIGLGHRLPY